MQTAQPLQFVDERSEPIKIKMSRALLGAFYGFLGSTTFALIAMLSDRLFYPHLPMGLDWDFYTTVWIWLGPGLILVGIITAWWYETWAGLLTGSLVAATVLLLSNMPTSAATLTLKVATFVIIFLPAVVICLPVVLFFRWLVKQHFWALKRQGGGWQIAWLFLLVLLVILVASVGGIFMRMPARAVNAVTRLDTALQTMPEPGSALLKLDNLDAHRGKPFELFYAKSTYTTQGYDVRAVYEDGYVIKCAVVVYSSTSPYITKCDETGP